MIRLPHFSEEHPCEEASSSPQPSPFFLRLRSRLQEPDNSALPRGPMSDTKRTTTRGPSSAAIPGRPGPGSTIAKPAIAAAQPARTPNGSTAGRSVAALAAIEPQDSDGDGTANAAEIEALRYPGLPASRPGQPLAPTVRITWDDLHKLPARRQFLLMNTTKEAADDYVNYMGVALLDVLKAAGIDFQGAGGVTVFAPDGYSIDVAMEDVLQPFPQGFFYAAPRAFAGAEKAFVKYPETIPPGVRDGQKIPTAPWLLLAFEREGKPLDPSSYEKGTGRLTGEGPFRLIKPQRELTGDPAKPGRPDRSMKSKTYGDGWDFSSAIDHNAGACVRGACVIRVNPMPAGVEEYDWKNGWPLIADRAVVIYGRGVKGRAFAAEVDPRAKPGAPAAVGPKR